MYIHDHKTIYVQHYKSLYCRTREEMAPPENELQKFGEKTPPNVSEHELRFRKSTEKLHVPDWYRERRTARTTDLDTSYSTTASERPMPNLPSNSYYSMSNQVPQYTAPPAYSGLPMEPPYTSSAASVQPISLPYSSIKTQVETSSTRYSTPFSYEQGRYNAPQIVPKVNSAALVIPYGMFDKYKDEISEMRRSRSSLHQIGGSPDERKVCIV